MKCTGESREYCRENTHVYAVELIEESFDSSAWFCVVFSVYYAHECLFLLCICFIYVVHVISCSIEV